MSHISGEDRTKLDQKGRFILKQPLRDMLGDTVYLYRHPLGSVRVASEARWDQLYGKLETLDNIVSDVAAVQTFLVGGACRVAVESDGRVKVAPHLQEWMGLTLTEQDLVVCPVAGEVELWGRTRYAQLKESWAQEIDGRPQIQVLCDRLMGPERSARPVEQPSGDAPEGAA